MYASVRKYVVDQAQMSDLMERVDRDFVSRVEGSPGFAGYHAIDCGRGVLITITLGEDRDAVERSMDVAAEFVRDELSDLEIERVEAATGEVGVTRSA